MEAHGQTDAPTTLKQLGMRACGTCVKAKAKCVPGSESRKCHRCHRLEKECRPSPPGSRKIPQSSQVAQLERKLDRIVTLLKTNSQLREDSIQESPACPPFPRSSSELRPSSAQEYQVTPLDELRSRLGCPKPGYEQPPSRFHPSIHLSGPTPPPYDFNIRTEEGELLLAEFRSNMAHHMPFVVIPPLLTSEDLRRDKPVLWKAVMLAALHSQPGRQKALGWKFMEDIGTRLLLKAEKSLDLLQALLVHLCWYHYHVTVNPQVINILHLIRGLVTNLGYIRNRTVKDRRQPLMEDVEDGSRAAQDTSVSSGSEKLEQWRAVAGCFAITSVSVSNCKGMSSFNYTSQMDEATKKMAEIQEYSSDKVSSQFCRLQRIALKVSDLYHEPEDSLASSAVPIKMYSKVLEAELENFKISLPPGLQHNDLLVSHFQLTLINLYELGLYSAFYPESEKAYRLSTLYSGLLAVKSYFNTHFTANASFSPSDPYFKWIGTGYVLLMGFKLCICTADGWDLDHARKVLDFPGHLNILILRLEAGIQLLNQDGGNCSHRPSIFSRFLRQARRFKTWYESMLIAETSEVVLDAAYPTPPSFQLSDQDLNMISDGFRSEDALMEIDESFWQSLMKDEWSENWYPGTPAEMTAVKID